MSQTWPPREDKQTSSDAQSWREQGLTVAVHRACSACGAPGVYSDVEQIQRNFPTCWVDSADPRVGQPVGSDCPHCKTLRAPGLIERLGEVWRRRFVK